MIRHILSVLSAIIAFGCFVPYAYDVFRGRARPARSTRFMFALLMVLALMQQQSVGSTWALGLTIGEGLGAFSILMLALWKGVGGLKRLDLFCYLLLAIDIFVWQSSHNSLLALHLTILADVIALWPTLVKTWRDPTSETPLFFFLGAIAPLFALAGEKNMSYSITLFPISITLENAIEFLLIYRHKFVADDAILTK